MSAEPFVGEIQAFPYGFVPKGWAACNGQLMNISTNTALFAIIGVTYGGNGTTNFALPDLRGRVPVSMAPNYPAGQAGGEQSHTLTTQEIPAHNHTLVANSEPATVSKPVGSIWGRPSFNMYASSSNTLMSPNALGATGGNAPHSNMQPYLTLNYCIALTGIFPSRG
ncbi:phage tail protein [Paenibacillus gorillae]|uniref:phage tail protein n=1 Tax=Paenibacillus gorillae TaxID=1243662 RepID=UPI0004B6A0E6|nr:tail fiber protein [Paenibacillus gorillae]